MAAEAERDGVEAIAAVGTAGMRIASNAAAFVDAVREPCGVEIEVIPGEEEARLAYVAATSGLGSPAVARRLRHRRRQLAVHLRARGRIEEQFSVNVGAARFTERFGLDGAGRRRRRSPGAAAIGADLSRSTAARRPTHSSGWAAASRTWPRSSTGSSATTPRSSREPSSTPPRSTARSSSTARGRPTSAASSPGLQPKRAEVILAGACIVRTVLDKLGRDSLVVSDRGLRHGLLVERFGR